MNGAAIFLRVLIGIHALLIVWGVLGLVEYFAPSVALGLQEPNFPAPLQFVHFVSILVTGTVFLAGYARRWTGLPAVMATTYGGLAALCFVETVFYDAFGGGPTRFIPMVLEFTSYLGISIFLMRSTTVHARLARGTA